jgi:hypothetical protein
MPNVIIIADRQVESICRDAVTFANSCQSDLNFYLTPQINSDNSPMDRPSLEVIDALEHLEAIKKQFKYKSDDLVLCFYNGTLMATSHGLSNLFCVGSRYDEEYPCTGVISLKYLGWDILEEKYNYEVQKHSILHLIVCGLIGSYTHLTAHKDIGCILDLNLRLTSFNLKLQKGYYLCSKSEYSCYDKVKNEKYGNSIIRLCEKFKSSNYQTIVNEIIMGDKIQVGDINNNSGQIAIGKNITISTSQDDRKNLAEKIDDLIKIIRQENIPEDNKQILITNFNKVKEEIRDEEEPDKSRIARWLKNTKKVVENIVLTHEACQAINWVYSGFKFIVQNIG